MKYTATIIELGRTYPVTGAANKEDAESMVREAMKLSNTPGSDTVTIEIEEAR